ncbi:hypothetical protein F5B22DRAFT_595053 [Xylaria bambusicola]|uniref:uncharacterized protein n=1 Tax=Xylaria bambusicola TaxID=326684 RepID=UPI002008535C|nr:uncharacterized protein F5B22DRAFT_595053 [Xylaria bambusicola]KAI0521457.1 hypothetical protein F5B22DRAFT_595053 [Xylaria bambusicola]
MSVTPRSSPPSQVPHTPDRTMMDQSLMVEPPSQLDSQIEEEIACTTEDITVRLNPQVALEPKGVEITNGAGHQGHQQRQRRARTPETQKRRSDRSEMASPGHLAPFDWDDFNDRYEKALQEADDKEKQMLEEFGQLVKYFNVWASASTNHDNERATKRLQTRERYVTLSEQSLSQKKQHLAEVVKAFQSALALLRAER